MPKSEHPHGLSDTDYDSLFTKDKHIIFGFHGCLWLIHRLTYNPQPPCSGYKEKGTITTPFELRVQIGDKGPYLKQKVQDKLIEHKHYVNKHGHDMPEIGNGKDVTTMALRLIEMVLQEKNSGKIQELLKEHKVIDNRQVRLSDGEILVRILLEAEQSEAILDLLEQQCAMMEEARVVILPVEATLPRDKPEPADASGQQQPEEKKSRISREELYEDIKDAARCSRVYLAMAVLSTIVAVVGFYNNSVAIIIGAMVIAPSIGPSMALSLATTLGDLSLLWRAFLTGLAGIGTSMALSAIIGAIIHVDPTLTEVASRTRVELGDIIVALAAGCAGALAFTTGISATLIGVMVAVALLPPLVAFGMLLGSGQLALSMGALSLFLMNIICVNLAGVTTFLLQGILPVTWWEKGRAKKATFIAIGLWVMLLAALVGLILLIRKG